MSKITHIGDKQNYASFYKITEVLKDCLSDVEKNPEQYNKMLILLLNDQDDNYRIQPYSAKFVHNTEVVALLQIAQVMYSCEILAYVDVD